MLPVYAYCNVIQSQEAHKGVERAHKGVERVPQRNRLYQQQGRHDEGNALYCLTNSWFYPPIKYDVLIEDVQVECATTKKRNSQGEVKGSQDVTKWLQSRALPILK